MIQILFSIIPILVFLVVFYLKRIKINNIIHLIFCGIISVILSIIFGQVLINIFPLLKFWGNYGEVFSKFFYYLIVAGMVEELSRYVALKISNPKSKNQIFINLFCISLIFIAIEDYGYMASANNLLKLGIYRAISPIHMFFATIMACFLSFSFEKNKEKSGFNIFEVMALVVPIIFHGVFDCIFDIFNLHTENINFLLIIVFVLLGYIIPILMFLKLKKEDVNKKIKFSKFINIIEAIFIFFIFVICFFALASNLNDVKFKESLKIEEKNIEVTINKVEEIVVNDSIFDMYNGKYVKVNLTIKNISDKSIIVDGAWSLVDSNTDEKVVKSYQVVDGIIDFQIPANSKNTGNIYFETSLKDNYKLEYSVIRYDKDAMKIVSDEYRFLLK